MFILTDVQQVPLTVAFADKAGNPANVDGAPVWTSSDPTIVTVTANGADGMSATAVAVGPLGQVQISVAADADLGAGVTTITGVLDIQVQSSTAVAAVVSTGTAVNKP